MYVSRLVYIVCLLEAVLWVQPNFALSNQRDMAKLLQSQTHQLNELAQNAAKDNTFSVLQKQLQMVAREQEMVARANIQIHNMQTALLDKASAKQTTVNRAQLLLPQLLVGHDNGGNGDCGGAAGKAQGKEAGVANGAVPLMSSNQAYTVACCLLIACMTVLFNESSPLPEQASETNASAAATAASAASSEEEDSAPVAVVKRPRDEDKSNNKEGRRGRKRARLGERAASPVPCHQAKKNNSHNNNKRRCKSDTVSIQSVASEESIVCSPTLSLSSGADSPSPVPIISSSSVFSTLPPELACEFEAEHAFYFHGIACNPSVPQQQQQQQPVSPVSAYPMYDRLGNATTAIVPEPQPQRIAVIDPALLLVEPGTPDLPQQDEGFTPSVSSGHGSVVDEEEEESTAASAPTTTTAAPAVATVTAPLFGVSNVEPLLQDDYFC